MSRVRGNWTREVDGVGWGEFEMLCVGSSSVCDTVEG